MKIVRTPIIPEGVSIGLSDGIILVGTGKQEEGSVDGTERRKNCH